MTAIVIDTIRQDEEGCFCKLHKAAGGKSAPPLFVDCKRADHPTYSYC